MTGTEETLGRIRTSLDGLVQGTEGVRFAEPRDGMPCVDVDRAVLHDVLERLRDGAGFETLTLVTGVDRLDPAAARPTEPRFELVHQLCSIRHGDRVRVRTRLASDDARAPTCTDLWPGAGFMERECWDMFGIEFEGHPKLERLLMPEGYAHHPLRKDFPHQGIEPDRLYREWDRQRREERPPEAVPGASGP
jgi:NADH:ubiquinone oxidoreductase subunit C